MVFAVLLAGCTRRSAAEGRMHSIEINRESLRSVQGRLLEENKEIPFTAYFQQMELQMIEQQADRYYYVEGNLFYYRKMDGEQVGRKFIVDRRGKLVATEPEPFPAKEYQMIASRAGKLKEQAISRAGHMFVFPLMKNR